VLQVVVGQPHGRGGTQLGVLVSSSNEFFLLHCYACSIFILHKLSFLNFFVNRFIGCFVDGT
jgi:hypothetical protein